MEKPTSYTIKREALPKMFPTHSHDPAFWESLGRVVATFGFLEQSLGRAIFAFTATKPYDKENIQKEFDQWIPKLEKALTDQLWNLIESFGKAVREHPDAKISNLDELLNDLKEASRLRNVICHASWGKPNTKGASVPFFVNRKMEIFNTPIDVDFLNKLQRHVSGLICSVVDTVTHMGWQFPGTEGDGEVIW